MMELGAEATTLEKAKNGFIGIFDGGLFSIWDRFCMDRVAVVVVEEENVVVAADRLDNKTTSLIGANLASDGMAVGEDLMGAVIWALLEVRWWYRFELR